MKKTVTVISLVAVMFTASVVPAASTPDRDDPPAACAGLVTQLVDTLKKVIGSLTAIPPNPGNAAAPLGDILGVLTALQGAKCLPTPPVSAPAGLPVPAGASSDVAWQGPEECLPVVMSLFSNVFGLLGKVLPGAGLPDPTKLLSLVTDLLKTLTDALQKCGLPAPPGGLPTVPGLPGLPT
ncbi:hypothetical protein Lesp02_75660 [Lentzea sp. NBRC 105346]|uniref:hypothetical protein n=1 Tax=Lentzea sp. NBRC 105346 TaxID=3032205 RepID=UPI0024A1C6C4|nr:hypothetical protein [Lentzea sp. NBRC 105346]GLZ35379.1 hypothetical protein Lesp02_75660 [Lentzea sp. NBRC 105346]